MSVLRKAKRTVAREKVKIRRKKRNKEQGKIDKLTRERNTLLTSANRDIKLAAVKEEKRKAKDKAAAAKIKAGKSSRSSSFIGLLKSANAELDKLAAKQKKSTKRKTTKK